MGDSAIGPLLAALIVLPFGQLSIAWFCVAVVLASLIMIKVGRWYSQKIVYAKLQPKTDGLQTRRV